MTAACWPAGETETPDRENMNNRCPSASNVKQVGDAADTASVNTLPPPPVASSAPLSPAPRSPAPPSPEMSPTDGQLAISITDAAAVASRLVATADAVIAGKHDIVTTAVATLLSGGHLLIEDIPGVGKTLLAQVLAASVGGSFRRIQGTSDLLPGDVTGSMVPAAPTGNGSSASTTMVFRPGPVFANVVVFDELNRTTPRTQSALLELAEEGTVSVDGVSHFLPRPFMLVATQNPIDIAGTYSLGEGSLDRFAAVATPGRAPVESEIEVLAGRQGRTMLDGVEPVASLDDIARVRTTVAQAHVADSLAAYVVDLLTATRNHPAIRLGASTRGGLALLGLARARAVMAGRSYVVADDIAEVAVAALAHRVITVDAHHSIDVGRQLVGECLAAVAAPTAWPTGPTSTTGPTNRHVGRREFASPACRAVPAHSSRHGSSVQRSLD